MPESAESDLDWDNLEVDEQRDRLPAAAQDCHDDVVGVWQGQSLLSNSWHHFTLDIKRKSSNAGEIEGTIYTEVWTGSEKDEEPPECVDDGHVHYTLEQPVEGRYEDNIPSPVRVLRTKPNTVDSSTTTLQIVLPVMYRLE